MIICIPPHIFEGFYTNRISCIIWFEDPLNESHQDIRNLLYEESLRLDCLVYLKIKFYSYDHLRYFSHIQDVRTILYLRNKRIVGSFVVKNEFEIKTVFNFFAINLNESIFLFNFGFEFLPEIANLVTRRHTPNHERVNRINVFILLYSHIHELEECLLGLDLVFEEGKTKRSSKIEEMKYD